MKHISRKINIFLFIEYDWIQLKVTSEVENHNSKYNS